MWTCVKCNAVNEDSQGVCPKCGAARSAGRFGAGAQTVRNSAAYVAAVPPTLQPARSEGVASGARTPQVQFVPDFTHVRAGGFAMRAGGLLMVLIPLFLSAVVALRFDACSNWLLSLFFDAPGEVSTLYSLLVYVPSALIALLVSLLPGLWTLLLGKAVRRLARMEELL